MSDTFVHIFKQLVHLNINLAFLVLLIWLLLGKGRGVRTTLMAWSVLLLRFFAEPWLCPESFAQPLVDHSQPGFLAVGLGLGFSGETIKVALGSGEQALTSGDLAVMLLGVDLAGVIGFLSLLMVAVALSFRVLDLWGSPGYGCGVIWSSDSDTPHISGWLRPTIVMPISAQQFLNEQELQAVLIHEKTHLENKDHWVFALIHLLRGFCLAVPPLFIVLNGLEQGLERRCDRRAADSVGVAAVATALVKMADYQKGDLCPRLAFAGSYVEARVRSLRPGYSKESRVVCLLAAFLLGTVIL